MLLNVAYIKDIGDVLAIGQHDDGIIPCVHTAKMSLNHIRRVYAGVILHEIAVNHGIREREIMATVSRLFIGAHPDMVNYTAMICNSFLPTIVSINDDYIKYEIFTARIPSIPMNTQRLDYLADGNMTAGEFMDIMGDVYPCHMNFLLWAATRTRRWGMGDLSRIIQEYLDITAPGELPQWIWMYGTEDFIHPEIRKKMIDGRMRSKNGL